MIEGCDAAVVALLTNSGEVLLIKRAEKQDDPWSGQIALPGGHREANESCEEAAKRETFEEVGYNVKDLKFIGFFSPHNKPLKVAAFLSCVKKFQPEVSPSEVGEAFWFDINAVDLNADEVTYKGYVIWGMTLRILKEIKRANLVKACQAGNDSS